MNCIIINILLIITHPGWSYAISILAACASIYVLLNQDPSWLLVTLYATILFAIVGAVSTMTHNKIKAIRKQP